MIQNIATKPHALYRFFGPGGELLYVGITNNPSRRFTQHGVQREWWHEVETIRMEQHPDREAVLLAEKLAIQTERPKYNVVHMGGAPVTTEIPERGTPGDYPMNVDQVVALCLAPNHHGEAACPVGQVLEVSPFGVKLGLYRWIVGYCDGDTIMVPWHRIMEITWADRMSVSQAERAGYGSSDDIYNMDPLGDVQTQWTKGLEYWRESMRARHQD